VHDNNSGEKKNIKFGNNKQRKRLKWSYMSVLLFFNLLFQLGFFDLLLGFFFDLGLPLFWLHKAKAGAAGALEQELHCLVTAWI